MEELEALLGLNRALVIQGYSSDFEIHLSSNDFDRFVGRFEAKHPSLIHYPEELDTLRKTNLVKIAGPGSYWYVRRK